MKPKNKKPLIIVFSIIGFIVLVAGLFFGSYYIFISKSNTSYEKSVAAYLTKINDVNKSVSIYMKDQSIDTNKIIKEMPANIDSLIAVKEKIQDVNPTEKFSKNHNNLLEGLNSNIFIYKQIVAALNNPQGKDIPQAMDSLMKYRDDCMNFYSLVALPDYDITLPKETLNLVNSVYSYLDQMSRIQRDLDVKTAQVQEFIDAIDKLNTQFTSIKTDFTTQAAKARTGSGTFDGVLAFLDKNVSDLTNIQSGLNISVPSDNNAKACMNTLKKTLDDYKSYLQSFKYALQTEKMQTEANQPLTPENITTVYSQANSKYNDVTKDYDAFLKAFNTLKASVISK